MHKQIDSIPDVEKDDGLRLFCDARRGAESTSKTKIIAVKRIVANWSVSKAFQGSTFQTAEESAAQKCLAEIHVANDVGTRTFNLPAFTVLMAKFIKDEVEERSFKKHGVE